MTYEFSMMLFLAAMVFTLIAQSRVSGNFKKYSQVRNQRGLTGEEAARKVLDANGLSDVTIEQIRGNLTDHYDPRTRVLRLSQGVYSIDSVAAVSVACHEAGHAIQHAVGYGPLKVRNSIVPAVNVASRLSWILILAGLIMVAAESHFLSGSDTFPRDNSAS